METGCPTSRSTELPEELPAVSGAPNEIWSNGEEVYEICKKYIRIRENMRPYTRALMQAAHEKGTPVIRPLFYDFPEDPMCWENESQYLYGRTFL